MRQYCVNEVNTREIVYPGTDFVSEDQEKGYKRTYKTMLIDDLDDECSEWDERMTNEGKSVNWTALLEGTCVYPPWEGGNHDTAMRSYNGRVAERRAQELKDSMNTAYAPDIPVALDPGDERNMPDDVMLPVPSPTATEHTFSAEDTIWVEDAASVEHTVFGGTAVSVRNAVLVEDAASVQDMTAPCDDTSLQNANDPSPELIPLSLPSGSSAPRRGRTPSVLSDLTCSWRRKRLSSQNTGS